VLNLPADAVGGRMGAALQALALPVHFDPFAKGLIASADVVYFVSLAILGLGTARTILASQRWR
jgi:hypothetical protein